MAEAIAYVRFKAYCEEYNNLNNFKSLDLSEAYRNTEIPGPTFLKSYILFNVLQYTVIPRLVYISFVRTLM